MSNSPKQVSGMASPSKKRRRRKANKKKDESLIASSTQSAFGASTKKVFGDSPSPESENEMPVDTLPETNTDKPHGKPQIDSIGGDGSTDDKAPYKPKQSTSSRKVAKSRDSAKIVTFHDEDGQDEAYHQINSLSKDELKRNAQLLLEVRQSLPIYQHKDEIIKFYQNNQVLVIIGETGSGKSTQIPHFLMPQNKKQIAVTQPRRVAAASLAQRVSEEYGCRLGEQVGYQVRFANVANNRTKLKYLTDGMLLREIMLDGTLNKYSTIIIDEAHERTILTDMILGFLKQLIITKKRPDLKVIVMSATLNAELFSNFFDAPILFVEGRTYPVSKFYLQDESEDVVDTMVRAVIQVNLAEQQGDILCFLPGQEEIDNAVNVLQSLAPDLPKEAPLIVPLPLYAALSPSQQLKIFEKYPKNKRKVILATNIAETSITVAGVRYVIDSGLRKVKVWKHLLGLSTLLTTTISQASAKQRAGRAGREAPGKVFRLYLDTVFNEKLPKEQESEIRRNDIVLPILTLKKIGVEDLLNWPWLEHPGEQSILSALSTLFNLGALDDNGQITSLGYKMAILPLLPQLSAVLITATEYGVLKEVIDIVACLSVDNLILNVSGRDGEQRDEVNFKRRAFCPLGCEYGDLIALKEYLGHFEQFLSSDNLDEAKEWCKDLHFNYKGFRNVLRVRKQLLEYMLTTIKQDDSLSAIEKEKALQNLKSQLGSEVDEDLVQRPLDIPLILKSFLKGYITNTAIGMPDRSYRTCSQGLLISIHPSSNLFGKSNIDAIMYIEYVFTAKGYARSCSAIELSWLQEVAPNLLGGTKVSIND